MKKRFNPLIKKHARFINRDVIYHVMSKTWGGRYFLAPTDEVNQICTGIVARACENFPLISVYNIATPSNHFHLMMKGPPKEFVNFVAFIKREISRRIGQLYDLPGSFWSGTFLATALLTEESVLECFNYILSQGTKEDLVERPQDWPGLHGAKHLMYGTKLQGIWFNGTKYAIAKNRASALKKPKPVKRAEFIEEKELKLTPLPQWQEFSTEKRQGLVRDIVSEIITREKERRQREGKKVLGVKAVKRMNIFNGKTPPAPPYWEDRRRVITAWAKLTDRATQIYLKLYWDYQYRFRLAADAFKAGVLDVEFPPGSWRPRLFVSSS